MKVKAHSVIIIVVVTCLVAIVSFEARTGRGQSQNSKNDSQNPKTESLVKPTVLATDRKSTRRNSSPPVTSSADLCLTNTKELTPLSACSNGRTATSFVGARSVASTPGRGQSQNSKNDSQNPKTESLVKPTVLATDRATTKGVAVSPFAEAANQNFTLRNELTWLAASANGETATPFVVARSVASTVGL